MMMGAWIIFGAASGFLANMFLIKKQQSWPLDMALGVLGAVFGGQMFNITNSVHAADSSFGSILVAIAGAIVAVVAFRTIVRRRNA
jgi:uncharacterized membrane protein YeaQ/YmgE (transglycosylase-associated protein family)